jgi:hypothetical protein
MRWSAERRHILRTEAHGPGQSPARMLTPLALLAALASAIAAVRAHRDRRRTHPAHAVIVSPRRSTTIAGDRGVRSVQSAKLTMHDDELRRLWTPANLENLGSTYWRFLTRAMLGLIRVIYDEDTRSVVLIGRPLTLLRFEKPTYRLEREEGAITWKIRDGLLVARAGRGKDGFLSLDVRRLEHCGEDGPTDPDRREILIEVEVANFYPSIAAGFSTPVYEMTQSAIHVLVTHAFLRSLTNLNLVPSRVGALAHRTEPMGEPPAQDPGPHTRADRTADQE